MPDRPRLTPAVADVRRAVREILPAIPAGEGEGPEALVALSGGPDSLALAAAAAFEGPRAGRRIGAVVVDHALQEGSAAVARAAADQAGALGLAPVLVRQVEVGDRGGPEAAARDARRAALEGALAETGATRLLLGHTLDDQAETVLLGLARGSGPDALAGMRADSPPYLRPLLALPRATAVQACADQGLDPWTDPHNADRRFARVRVRLDALPALESALGPGVAAALARTAEQLREDAAALDALAEELAPELVELAEGGLALPADALAANPAGLAHRLVRLAVEGEFGTSLSRTQTLAVMRLATDWHGQGPVHLPGVIVERQRGRIVFRAARP
ncbi:tRNA lysidine(34) synthetase TilS [Amnibacterium sp. CER49]|uniref:tRNA lysidine(34) synthetase TilS n=1 Tax=Amnibacterium sp. CER49 TaxID=3039161 RepID=UPI00244C601F|nr:tRNA lysidine(34) synthetase TilS [Amnibacterium sp. CER49]MDH2443781.1 tRNA lysidine(34) synthetase TilS [Amnibacterium sp. CER49]